MKIKTFLLLSVSAVLFCACDNIFEETIADKNSGAAKTEELEIALNDRNYDKIISGLGFNPDKTGTDTPQASQFSGLSAREKYLLQNALLGKTGFNAVDILSAFLEDDNNDSTSDVLLKSLSSADKDASDEVLNPKQKRYAWAKKIKDTALDDKDIATAAGIAATLDTLMAVTKIANNLLGELGDLAEIAENVSFDPQDDNYIGKVFNAEQFTNETTRQEAIENAINAVFPDDTLSGIVENITMLEDTIKLLVPEGQTEMVEKLNEYTDKFKEMNNTTGKLEIKENITPAELADFIMDQWKKN
jgi:hypothetical protein